MTVRSFLSPKVKLRKSPVGGKGLFAQTLISQGELIVDYSTGPGQYLETSHADTLYEEGNDYMIQVDDNRFFVAVNQGELEDADYINHSCDPNCGIHGALKIVAMRDIQSGEEITFDYAMCESTRFAFRCACGTHICRGIVTGDDWKNPALRGKYKGFFSDYLERKIRRDL